jgi:hypothetical protein
VHLFVLSYSAILRLCVNVVLGIVSSNLERLEVFGDSNVALAAKEKD